MQVFQPISRYLPGMAITCLHSFETKEKIFPWIADSFSFSICASLSNCAAVQWVYFHLWSLILFHLISGDCWPTYCEIFKKNSCLDIVAFLVAEINHFRKFICLFYAVCLCVNGPSNRLHGRMQSRTGCICLTFLHCVFLNAVSDCLHYMKYNHTCCMVTCGDGFSPECILCALSKHSQKSYIYHTNYSWNVLKGFLRLGFAPWAVSPGVHLCWAFKWCQKKRVTKGHHLKLDFMSWMGVRPRERQKTMRDAPSRSRLWAACSDMTKNIF